jgi:hypothetical protein
MQYDELHQRYGGHIAKRVEQELLPSEFQKVTLQNLMTFLETRAEAAHLEYQKRLDQLMGQKPGADIDVIYQSWREAEDLAYLISVAEDISLHYREASRR